jgi:hypothetical protein
LLTMMSIWGKSYMVYPWHSHQTLILRVRIPSKQVNLPPKGVTQANPGK